jgi:hypothetical protein
MSWTCGSTLADAAAAAHTQRPLPALAPAQEGAAEEVEPEAEAVPHRLCPEFAPHINSPLRHVRTRIYFTSESHIHSLVNVLRYCHLISTPGACPCGLHARAPCPVCPPERCGHLQMGRGCMSCWRARQPALIVGCL